MVNFIVRSCDFTTEQGYTFEILVIRKRNISNNEKHGRLGGERLGKKKNSPAKGVPRRAVGYWQQ